MVEDRIKNEIINSTNKLNFQSNCFLLENKWIEIDNKIKEIFVENDYGYSYWDGGINFDYSEHNENAYLKTECLKNKECYLFIREEKDCLFLIKDGYYIKDIIGECFLFEYYIIDINFEWIICNNHHDYYLTKNININ